MKRQFPITSSVDEPQRNVRSRNPSTLSMPRQSTVSLEQPPVNFQPGVQSMGPNIQADHQSPTLVLGENITGSSDTPQDLQELDGSTSPCVCTRCGGLMSSSELPPLSDPLVPSPVDEPQRNVRSLNPFSQGQTSNDSQYQNPHIIQPIENYDMLMDINDMSYEELLALAEMIGKVNTGVKTSELSKFVKEVICCGKQDEAERCVICLEQYVDADAKGQLKCGHEYHFSCIGKWMEEQAVCPICRQRAVHFEQ